MVDLQEIADDLAEAIGRGVAIDDRHLRLLVHSAHHEDADPIRGASILTRTVPKALSDWAFSCGIQTAERWIRVPAAPQLESEARVVFPLRSQDLLLGFLTVLDPDETLDDPAIEACVAAAAEAAALRYRRRLLQDSERAGERRLVGALLFGGPEEQRSALRRLRAEGLLDADRVIAVIVNWRALDGLENQGLDVLVARAFDRARRDLPPGSMAEFQRSGSAVALIDARCATGGDGRALAGNLLGLARDFAAGATLAIEGGFGSEVDVAEAPASYEQAARALDVAERLGDLSSPVGWCDLGANRLVSLLALEERVAAAVPSGCKALFEEPELLETVESYLDLACNAKATAGALSLHRASLYSRLQKAERITGLSFKSGDDRLALHLGLRLLRLGGCSSAEQRLNGSTATNGDVRSADSRRSSGSESQQSA